MIYEEDDFDAREEQLEAREDHLLTQMEVERDERSCPDPTGSIFRMLETVRFLDKQCLSVQLGNKQGQFLGHWTCDGDFLETVERARKRLNQSEKIQSNA